MLSPDGVDNPSVTIDTNACWESCVDETTRFWTWLPEAGIVTSSTSSVVVGTKSIVGGREVGGVVGVAAGGSTLNRYAADVLTIGLRTSGVRCQHR